MYKDISSHYTLYKRGPYWGYYYYDKTNKRHFRSTGRKTKYEAQKVIADRIKLGELAYKVSSNILFKDFAKDFFIPGKCPYEAEKIKLDKKVSATTMSYYRKCLIGNWIPMLDNLRLIDINKELILNCRVKLKEKGLKGRTINNNIFVLGIILSTAVKQGIITNNPIEDIEALSTTDSKERDAFTLDDIRKIISQEWEMPIYRDIFILGCMTGMRIGEIIALKKKHIKDGYIEVCENYSHELKLTKDTKNHKSRVVPITQEINDMLIRYSEKIDNESFIFNINGKPIVYITMRKKVKKVLEAAGIEGNKTFHSTRHFFDSSLYVDSGIDKERIKAVMGHSSDDMFRRYLHIKEDSLSEVKEAQENIYKRISDNEIDNT